MEQDSLNGKSRVQVCDPTCTGEFALRLRAWQEVGESSNCFGFTGLNAYQTPAAITRFD